LANSVRSSAGRVSAAGFAVGFIGGPPSFGYTCGCSDIALIYIYYRFFLWVLGGEAWLAVEYGESFNLSRSVPFDEYRDSVLASLCATVAQVRADMNWQKGDSLRLVFHSFTPFKDTEAEAVKEVMTELGEFDVHYAFLHVIEDHPTSCSTVGRKGSVGPGSR
jgi:hypothetical protein